MNWFHRLLCSMGLVMICKQTPLLLCAHEKQTSVVGDERVILARPGEVIFILRNKSWSGVSVTIGYATRSKHWRLLFIMLLPGSNKTMGDTVSNLLLAHFQNTQKKTPTTFSTYLGTQISSRWEVPGQQMKREHTGSGWLSMAASIIHLKADYCRSREVQWLFFFF